MTYRSVIQNFSSIGIEQAEKLREQLSLSMPAEMLKFCGKYYKSQIKRDPFADELQMLDKLVNLRESIGSSLAITEFLTNDAFSAYTYADMLKKRKQLFPEFAHPITIGEAVNFANEFIRRKSDKTARVTYSSSIENVKDCVSYPDPFCVSTASSAFRMRMLPLSHTEIADGDILVLISPIANDTATAFRRKSATLLQDRELMRSVKGVSCVGKGGIIRELLNMTDGAVVHLSSLSPIGTSVPATALCDGFSGCCILRVAEQQWNTVATLLAGYGVRSVPFASIQREPKFVFVRDVESSFTLDTHFLRSLNRYTKARAKLADEAVLPPAPIVFGGIGGGKCAYLSPKITGQLNEVVQADKSAFVTSYTQLESAPYKTALWSVLAPIVSLCTRGVPYSQQSLSIALELPTELTDSAIAGKSLSAILGIYRAQTELGLATAGDVHLRTDEALKSPSVSVWSTAENIQKIPSTFSKGGSFVYALSPALDQDGLPDFSALRQMLTQLASLANEGKILACRTLVTEAVTDGICKMSNTHTCILTDKAAVAEGKLPLCILIESEHLLPARLIGRVQPWYRTSKAEVMGSKENSNIVIVSTLTDDDATALAAFLENRGATVSRFVCTAKDDTALSSAILKAQTLILCSDAKLPQTEQIHFALDTFRCAGGILLSLSKNSSPEGFVSLKSGIDEAILEKICP